MASRVDVLTPRGLAYREMLPPILRDSEDYLAVLHPMAREMERLEDAIESVRAQFFPQSADVLLDAWEAQLRTTIEPEGDTVDARRALVLALLRKMHLAPSGLAWEAAVTGLIGEGWTYEEHDPDDPGSPPENTLRIVVPFPPAGDAYARARARIEDISPAHLDIVLAFSGGFLLDESQLDQEGLG